MLSLKRVCLTFALLAAACSDESSTEREEQTSVGYGDLIANAGCAAPTGQGTAHQGTIDADETWTAASGPHLVTAGLSIRATVTLEPCVTVLVSPGVVIDIGSSSSAGHLVANGEASASGSDVSVRAVTFKAAQDGQPWGQILVNARGSVDLKYTALIDGGAIGSGPEGALVARGDAGGTNDAPIVNNVHVNHVAISHSASRGAVLDGWAAFTNDSDTLWITNSGTSALPEAISIEPGVVSSLPSHLTLMDNVSDTILLRTSKAFLRDDTLVDVGFAYRVPQSLYIAPSADGSTVTLNVEPGVIVQMAAATSIIVGSSAQRLGVLVAEGNASKPITFTSSAATPAAGDWSSLYYRYFPLAGNKLHHVNVQYAGGDNQTNGFGCGPGDNASAIVIFGQNDPSTSDTEDAPPSEVFVQNCAFDHIAGQTVIVSGWTDDAGPNFSATNSFGSETGMCKVSRPKRGGAGDVCDGGRDVCWP